MALDLRANTAVDVLIGPFVDSTDGNTAETALTLSQADIRLSKNGQNMAQKNDVTAAAHDELGYYNCELDATDLNTEGTLILSVHESGALPVRHEYNVMSEAAWDSLYIAKDDGFMDVNIKTVGRADTQETEANNLESACGNYSAARGLTGTALPAAAADAAGGVPISDAGGLDLDAKLANTNEITAARMGALTDWINGGRLDLLLDAIPTTAMRGTDNAALASVLGALNDAASAGDPTDADTLVQYIKQLINVLIGTTGIAAFPAEAAPANAVSLAEVIRAIHADVTGLNGSAMVGTNGANTVVPDAAGVAPTAIEIQAEMEENGASLLDTLRDDLADGGRLDLIFDATLAMLDDARGEPGQGNPPVNADAMTKLDYLYKWTRNQKDNDGTTTQFYNDAGAVVDQKQTTSEAAGTVMKTEIVTGP